MKLKILQRSGDKSHHHFIEDAAFFFAKHLFEDEDFIKLNLRIAFRILHNDFEGYLDFDTLSRVKSSYEIIINKNLKVSEQISVLAHELTHVKQVHAGKLCVKSWSHGRMNIVDWCGVMHTEGATMEYYAMPWEIEAHLVETKLLNLWKRKF